MPQVAPDLFVIHFPKAGMDRSRALASQPSRDVGEGTYARTCQLGVNVRAFEQSGRRRRGGSRRGLSRYIDAIPGDTAWLVQHLGVVATTGGSTVPVQTSQAGRIIKGLAVVQGNVYWFEPGGTTFTAASNQTGRSPALNFSGVMASTACVVDSTATTVSGSKRFFADGVNYAYYSPSDDTVRLWEAHSGTLPQDDAAIPNKARLLTTWRSRVVAAGVIGKPHALHMSRVNDPFDWDYASANNDAGQAWQGSSTSSGNPPDVITSLFSYSDDVLVIGGDTSVRLFRGDPYHGGQIDLVTNRVGMAWGSPWAMDGEGVLYFFSSTGGVYAMDPRSNSPPVRISGPIEQLVQGVNTGTHTILLEWDDTFQELRVFVTYTATRAVTDHYVWEKRTKAWWVDRYANTVHNPLASCILDGNRPTDRVVLVGGWDGYVRFLDPNADDDDGTSIESEVIVGPLKTGNLDEIVIDQSQAVLGEGSGAVEMEFLTGKTAEVALASDPIPVATLTEGRNPTHAKRVAGHEIYVRMTSPNQWSLEQIRVRTTTKGRTRRRVS